MSNIDSLIDIYSLESHYDSNCDYRNVILLSIEQAMIRKIPMNKDRNLICEKCKGATIFIYDSSIGYICPLCLYLYTKNKRNCQSCYKKQGCDSCGGMCLSMVQVFNKSDNLLLCIKNKCLMPFGYHINKSYSDIPCSCERDALYELSDKLPKDIVSIISKMVINPQDVYWFVGKSLLLEDLSWTNPNKCLSCQLTIKYKLVSKFDYVNGYDYVCQCSSCNVGNSVVESCVKREIFRLK